VFVATNGLNTLGTYYIRPNNTGGGAHVANCGYITAPKARGKGLARAMCIHSQKHAKSTGYTAMQFNFVIATNIGAIRLWEKLGYETAGRLPKAFCHPKQGMVDALVMFKALD
jgi:ribosomal protein S18 acetylase RimI-like enzyme